MADYSDPKLLAKAALQQDQLVIVLDDEGMIVIPKNLVLMVRDLCNMYIMQYGAFDGYGREVIDTQTRRLK